MAMTDAQLIILRDAILANPTWNAFPETSDGAFGIAALLNVDAVPDFTVWKTNVPLTEVSENMNGVEWSSLTTAETGRLQSMADWSPDGIDSSKQDRRDFFDDIFNGAGGNITRPQLLALWKRLATEGEKVFATGTGSDAAPAQLDYEGAIPYQDVQAARAL